MRHKLNKLVHAIDMKLKHSEVLGDIWYGFPVWHIRDFIWKLFNPDLVRHEKWEQQHVNPFDFQGPPV